MKRPGVWTRPLKFEWLRGLDLNQRPSGYEPDELPGCSTPQRHDSGCGVERQTNCTNSAPAEINCVKRAPRAGDLARTNSFQTGSQIFRVDSRGEANGSKVLIVIEQKLFRFALLADGPFAHSSTVVAITARHNFCTAVLPLRRLATSSLTSSPIDPLFRPNDSTAPRWPHTQDKGQLGFQRTESQLKLGALNLYGSDI